MHADADSEVDPERNDALLSSMEPVLEAFPPDLVKYGWNFEVESGGWDEPGYDSAFSRYDFDDADGDDIFLDHGRDPYSSPHGSGEVVGSFSESKYSVWTNDFHIATVANVKSLLKPKGVVFVDKSL